jgi:hypothetical protein
MATPCISKEIVEDAKLGYRGKERLPELDHVHRYSSQLTRVFSTC